MSSSIAQHSDCDADGENGIDASASHPLLLQSPSSSIQKSKPITTIMIPALLKHYEYAKGNRFLVKLQHIANIKLKWPGIKIALLTISFLMILYIYISMNLSESNLSSQIMIGFTGNIIHRIL